MVAAAKQTFIAVVAMVAATGWSTGWFVCLSCVAARSLGESAETGDAPYTWHSRERAIGALPIASVQGFLEIGKGLVPELGSLYKMITGKDYPIASASSAGREEDLLQSLSSLGIMVGVKPKAQVASADPQVASSNVAKPTAGASMEPNFTSSAAAQKSSGSQDTSLSAVANPPASREFDSVYNAAVRSFAELSGSDAEMRVMEDEIKKLRKTSADANEFAKLLEKFMQRPQIYVLNKHGLNGWVVRWMMAFREMVYSA